MKTKDVHIKTVEDVLKYKDTDTKIYSVESDDYYFKFVNGYLCRFYNNDRRIDFNCGLFVKDDMTYYVKESCEPGEGLPMATTRDVGELCLFWDDTFGKGAAVISKLVSVIASDELFPYYSGVGSGYKHCTRLTTRVVKELKEASEDD